MPNESFPSAERFATPAQADALYKTAIALGSLAERGKNFIDREAPEPPAELFDNFAEPATIFTDFTLEVSAVPEASRDEDVRDYAIEHDEPSAPIADVWIERVEHLEDTVTRASQVSYKVFEDPMTQQRELLKIERVGVKAQTLTAVKPEHFPEGHNNGSDVPLGVNPQEATRLIEYIAEVGAAQIQAPDTAPDF